MKTRNKSRRSLSMVFILFLLAVIYLTAASTEFSGIYDQTSQALLSMETAENFAISRVIEFVVETVSYSL